MLIIASLQGEAASVWERVVTAAQTSQLFWIALVVAVVALTPNTAYVWLFAKGKALAIKHIVKPTPQPPESVITPPPTVVTPVGTIVEPKTAKEISDMYHAFRAKKAARVTELEQEIAKERQEIIDLDQMISKLTPVVGVTT